MSGAGRALAAIFAVAALVTGGCADHARQASPEPPPVAPAAAAVTPSPPAPPPCPEAERAKPAVGFIGLTELQAAARAGGGGGAFRVSARNGKARVLTMEYAPGRVSVCVNRGEVTAAYIG